MAPNSRRVDALFHTTTTLLILLLGTAVIATNTSTPAPLSLSPSEYWDGVDGPWSTFQIQVGTPGQDFRVLPASSQSAPYLVLNNGGCPGVLGENLCVVRGYSYQQNASSTWTEKGDFSLSLTEELALNYSGNATYGWDSVTLGWPGTTLPTVNHTLVGGYTTLDFFIGLLGLSHWNTNFTNFEDGQPAMLQTLYSTNQIPSRSWAYTAGANYQSAVLQNTPAYGSLTLGGYDTSMFIENGHTFTFGPDITRELLPALQSITSDTTTDELLPTPVLSFIDSTVPYIWLPTDACAAFEKAFGLEWDPTTELYLVNSTLHANLTKLNPNITFTFGNTTTGPAMVNITLPYAAFDLTAEYPLVENTTSYFPLQRAYNSTQYTIGRTLLQNAYIIVDYDRQNFTLAQAVFPSTNTKSNIVAIHAPNSTGVNGTSPGLGSSHTIHFSPGAIAGISIGAVFLVALVATLAAVLIIRTCHRRKPDDNDDLTALRPHELHGLDKQPTSELAASEKKWELAAADVPFEVEGPMTAFTHETDGYPRATASGGSSMIYELPAADVPSVHLASPTGEARPSLDTTASPPPRSPLSETRPSMDNASLHPRSLHFPSRSGSVSSFGTTLPPPTPGLPGSRRVSALEVLVPPLPAVVHHSEGGVGRGHGNRGERGVGVAS